MTRDKILMAAKELFEEKGFDRTTVREVAGRAKANVALISYYFGSKENLLSSLVEEMSSQIRLRVTDISTSSLDPKEKLKQAIDFYVERLHSNCDYYQMVHRELGTQLRPELRDSITKILKRNKEGLKHIFEEGQELKVFRADVDIDMTISTIFGLLYQTTHAQIKKKIIKPHEDAEAFKVRVKKHLWDMLTRLLIK